jgi:hypothetical protein
MKLRIGKRMLYVQILWAAWVVGVSWKRDHHGVFDLYVHFGPLALILCHYVTDPHAICGWDAHDLKVPEGRVVRCELSAGHNGPHRLVSKASV